MRVLHVIPSIAPSEGGLRTGTLATCRAQSAAGLRPEIACLNNPDPDDPDDPDDLPIHRFKPGRRLFGASKEMRLWLMGHAADYGAIIAHVVWLNPAHYAATAAGKAGVPLYLASRGMLDPDAMAHHRLRKLIAWHAGVRKLIGRGVLVFSSQADRDRSLSHPDLQGAPAVVVPNPVEMSDLVAGDPAHIVCLNRLHPRKGVLEWVQSLLRLRDEGLRFTATHAGIAQDHDYAARVRDCAAPLVHEGRLHFEGPLPHDRARALLGGAGILVHPAVGFENFGNVILEGMGAGKPVVASRRALVTPELEQHGVVIGVEPTPTHIADALRRLLQDKAAGSALGGAAREYARAHFSYAGVGTLWANCLLKHSTNAT
ncbi:MAG: glycosyltransferase [Planctomycetes bacterium]|nr:glycosyltransferase [Planctomycetota bacterium]